MFQPFPPEFEEFLKATQKRPEYDVDLDTVINFIKNNDTVGAEIYIKLAIVENSGFADLRAGVISCH